MHRLALALLLAATTAAFAQAPRPNVLLIVGDDHAPYVYGTYGNEKVRTPNLDRLAAEGMRFDRAYCNSPMCTPSRQSFLTGRYPRSVGVTRLRDVLSEDALTLGDCFGAADYATAAIGKMHFNSNLKHGFALRVDRPQHNAHLKQTGTLPIPDGVDTLGPWRPFQDHARVWLNSACLPFPALDRDMPSHFFVEQADAFLSAPRDEPFFLIASFTEPHSPFHFPVEYAGRHDPSTFKVPEIGPDDDAQIPVIFRDLTHEEKQGIIAAYYTSTEYLDMNVGRVLDALQRSGKADNTIVVYLGDHGYSLGHHGRFEKHTMYEPAVRSPLVVRYPGTIEAGAVSDALVEFVDLFPTLTELTALDTPGEVQGRSFADVLRGNTTTHRDHVIVEYAENEEIMIRDTRWKFVYGTGQRHRDDGYATLTPTPGRTVRLYDTVADPDEFDDLSARPEHADRIATFEQQLETHLRATQPPNAPIPEDLAGYGLLDWALNPDNLQSN